MAPSTSVPLHEAPASAPAVEAGAVPEAELPAGGPEPSGGSGPDPAQPVIITTPGVSRQFASSQGERHESVGLPDTGSPVPDSTFTWGGYFQAIGILLLLLLALWLALRVVRRFGEGRFLPAPSALPRQALRLEAQLPLGQRRGLYVVRFLNKRLVLGVTDQHITLLSEADAVDDEEHHARFQQVMEKAGREGGPAPCRPVDSGASAGTGPGGAGGNADA